jgi:3-dehydrosphinganine reductase
MNMAFKDKNVLITGGTSGIGLELARQLAYQKARVVILARSTSRLDEVCKELKEDYASTCQFFSVDVSREDEVKQSISQIIETTGLPDLLINSAGVAHPGYVQDLELDIFHWMMDVNYFGTVNVTKALLPGMIARGSGHIVNIASMSAVIGLLGYSAYGASKFALRGFSDALRMEMKPHGIHVSIVYPADTDTPQLEYENNHKPQELRDFINMLPATDPVPPEQVASQILKGIERKKEVIFPDSGMALLFKLINIVGNGVYPIIDWLFKRAQKNSTGVLD